MKQSELIAEMAKICEGSPLSKRQCAAAMKAFLKVAGDALAAGGDIRLQGIGTLKTVDVAARNSYNPSHKQKEVVPAHKRVRFIQSAVMSKALKG